MSLIYRFLSHLAGPFIRLYLLFRLKKGREDAARFQERLGVASCPRPHGRLVWCHAASVGETLSVLTLLHRMVEQHPDLSVLLTTGTVTSAKILQGRLPIRTVHQYVPVDRWSYVNRFLKHWKPDLALWVESELWPNMLTALSQRKVPAILLNGRMSEKSYRRWRMMPGGAKEMMGVFALGLAQSGADRNRYAALGMKDVRVIGNLKYASAPLPFEQEALTALQAAIGSRPVWLMASTHPGEEEIALAVHKKLHRTYANLLTIIAPRHPARGQDIEGLILKEGHTYARRSQGEEIKPETAIYLADTMGELGLFYRLCPLCCLAGSFTWGGHNPVEPAQLGCAVLFGPKMDNFALMADDILSAGAALQVMDEVELEHNLHRLLASREETENLGNKARAWSAGKQAILADTLATLSPFLNGKSP